MARRPRVHVPGGTYYLVEQTSHGRELFTDPGDHNVLEALLAGALKRMSSHALAYCWLPRSLHLVVQIESVPLGRVLQGFLSHYAQYVHQRTGDSGHLFAGHYRSALIEPEAWLAPLIRYLHFLPVLTAVAAEPAGYEHTSHHAYALTRRIPWIETRRALSLIARSGRPDVYASLMSERPSQEEIELLGLSHGTTVLGSDAFKARLPRSAREYHPTLSLEQIITQVSRLLQISREDLTSQSRNRSHAFARSVIA